MASEIAPGTALRGPDGETAVKMDPSVTAYSYFVIHPKNGGHPVSADQLAVIEGIEAWTPGEFPVPAEPAPTA